MDFIKIDPDNAERNTIQGFELPEEARTRFDYYAWPTEEEWDAADNPDRWGEDGPLTPKHGSPGNWGKQVGWYKKFVLYKDQYIDIDGGTESADTPGWDRIDRQSFFSGIFIKYARECSHSDVQHYNQCPTGQIDDSAVYIAEYMQASTQDWGWAVAAEIGKYHEKVQNDPTQGWYSKSLAEAHLFELATRVAKMLKRWDENFDTESFMKSATGQK